MEGRERRLKQDIEIQITVTYNQWSMLNRIDASAGLGSAVSETACVARLIYTTPSIYGFSPYTDYGFTDTVCCVQEMSRDRVASILHDIPYSTATHVCCVPV